MPRTSLAKTKSTHPSVAYKTPCMAHILHYEITCKSFKHLKVLNIQKHKVDNIKFNMHLNLIFYVFSKFFWLLHLLTMSSTLIPLLQRSFPILGMVEFTGWPTSTPNANSKGLTPMVECFVKL